MVDRSETFVKGKGEKNFRSPPFSRGGGIWYTYLW